MKMQGVFLVAIAYTLLVKGQHQPHQDCQTKCGNITIEYPFGISSGCYYPEDASFDLSCDQGELNLGDLQVISFSYSGELRVFMDRSFSCYNNSMLSDRLANTLGLASLTLSNKNRFTVVGCNTFGVITTIKDRNSSTGCLSLCDFPPEEKGVCSGEGCCQTSVPQDSNNFLIQSSRLLSQRPVVNSCFYAFLVEQGKFNFSPTEDLKDLRNETRFPIVLDWSIGNQTCKQAGNTTLCGRNSRCSDATTRSGYLCRCNDGFDGNPYLSNGCKDINECTSSIHKHNCSDPKTCRDKDGGFDCECESNYRLDTTTMSCKRKEFGWPMIVLGTTIGFLFILLGFICLKQRMKQRKDTELREKFFEQNGGGMLIQRLTGATGSSSNIDVKIFTEEGMKEATNDYDESGILGQGGQGTVYKGILSDNSVVAIKKARLGDSSSQVEQFIYEVFVLSQINHRNVVKLLGCCLETEIPLLVYEFIASGTLYDHLHGSMFDSSLTWEHRLRIAIEVAGTLAYLHSSASIPIIHRDIKTANILLDDNLTAKVADFGASRLIPMDQEQLVTMVQGTVGYLDPEYYNTGLLNEKSDVYSFGVVLMELISGQKALCFERAQTSKHIVSYFVSAMKEKRLHEIIDGQVVMDEENLKEIHKAARVAIECTRVTGEERPRMKEVAAELEALKVRVKSTKHKWSDLDQCPDEIKDLLGGHSLSTQGDTYDSIKNVPLLDIEAGR